MPDQGKLEISGRSRRRGKDSLVQGRVFLHHGFCNRDYLEHKGYRGEDGKFLNVRQG